MAERTIPDSNFTLISAPTNLFPVVTDKLVELPSSI
jgi:hypothetical protein